MTAETQDKFVKEIKMMFHLLHPNILSLVAWSDSPMAMVLEFAPHGDLQDFYRKKDGPYSVRKAVELCLDCARGMVYLHSWNPAIIHRDLKSSNVLITASWTGKVADCGESRRKAMNTTMTQIGTPFWCAPEILNGGVYDEKVCLCLFAWLLFS